MILAFVHFRSFSFAWGDLFRPNARCAILELWRGLSGFRRSRYEVLVILVRLFGRAMLAYDVKMARAKAASVTLSGLARLFVRFSSSLGGVLQ